jgi:hypothetical protein
VRRPGRVHLRQFPLKFLAIHMQERRQALRAAILKAVRLPILAEANYDPASPAGFFCGVEDEAAVEIGDKFRSPNPTTLVATVGGRKTR